MSAFTDTQLIGASGSEVEIKACPVLGVSLKLGQTRVTLTLSDEQFLLLAEACGEVLAQRNVTAVAA